MTTTIKSSPHSWQSYSKYTLYSEPPPSSYSIVPAANIHPGHTRISESGKLCATWLLLTLRSTKFLQIICLPPSKRLHSDWGITKHDVAGGHGEESLCHRLLTLRQALWSSNWADIRELPPSNSWKMRISQRQGFEPQCVHSWPTERCFYVRPQGKVSSCRLWSPSLRVKLWQPPTSYLANTLVWKLKTTYNPIKIKSRTNFPLFWRIHFT